MKDKRLGSCFTVNYIAMIGMSYISHPVAYPPSLNPHISAVKEGLEYGLLGPLDSTALKLYGHTPCSLSIQGGAIIHIPSTDEEAEMGF